MFNTFFGLQKRKENERLSSIYTIEHYGALEHIHYGALYHYISSKLIYFDTPTIYSVGSAKKW
jgi:hypothetical protein